MAGYASLAGAGAAQLPVGLQKCRQSLFPRGAGTNVGLLNTRNHPQVSHLLKSKQRLRLRATAARVSEFQAVLTEEVTKARISPPVELSETGEFFFDKAEEKIEDSSSGLGQEGGVPDVESSSPPTSGDVPSLLDGADSSPSTSAPAVDALQSAGEGGSADKAALSAQEEYLKLMGGNRQDAEQGQAVDFGDSMKAAQDAIGDSLKSAQDGIGDSLKAAQDGINNAQDAVAKSAEGVVDAVRGSADSAGSSVKNAYESVNGSIVRALKSVTAPFSKSVEDVQSSVEGNAEGVAADFTSVFRVGTPANDALKGVVSSVKNATDAALGAAGSAISQAYSTTKDHVPPEVQSFFNSAEEKVAQITGPVGSAINQVYVVITDAERAVGLDPGNPVIPIILVVGGSLFIGFAFFNIRYGGYSGDLPPSEALDVLKKENAILVDIRPQEARDAEGIPDLRRSTRSKFAVVEVVKVEGAVRGLLKNTTNVESLITATVIRNLKNAKGGSQFIVLDSDGGQSKRIAKGLRTSGARRAYRVDGGFKAWASSGLRVKGAAPQSALAILQEDAEEIVEEVKPTPIGILGVILGSVAGVYALIEWEKTLQFIGLIGAATSLYSRISSYESAEDAKADLKLLRKPFALVIQGIVSIAGLIEPKKLQLATSPVSSNVQGRVMQAAAKHGLKASELELVEEEEEEEEEVVADEVPAVVEQEEGGEVESAQTKHTSVQDPE